MNSLKTDYNAKIIEIEVKIPSITGLTTTAALNAVDNNIPNISSLVKKDYNAKISDIESKYFTTSGYNKFTNEMIGNKLKEKQLVKKMQ